MRPADGCIPYGMQGMGNLHFLPSEPFSTGRTIFYRANHSYWVNFPQHKDKTVYLALAGMSFNPLTEQACKEAGIAIIKQAGETIVIFDDHLKTF